MIGPVSDSLKVTLPVAAVLGGGVVTVLVVPGVVVEVVVDVEPVTGEVDVVVVWPGAWEVVVLALVQAVMEINNIKIRMTGTNPVFIFLKNPLLFNSTSPHRVKSVDHLECVSRGLLVEFDSQALPPGGVQPILVKTVNLLQSVVIGGALLKDA